MTASGFDVVTGMFGAFNERAFKVPARPDRAAAERALSELTKLLDEFSFVGEHDLSAALALILTAAIRPALPVAPMGYIRAPQISSGKSYLSALISTFAGPSKPSAQAFPSNDEEASKLLLAALAESPAVISFDNLTTDLVPFKSLCSALTEEFVSGRLLGFTKMTTVPTQTLFLSSGNNVGPVRDMTRRVLTVMLDPAIETPATRSFTGDPVAVVRRDREKFVSFALTIVRAYLVAGRPYQELKPLGGYSDWTDLVRRPLAWLGLADPATAIFDRMQDDPDRANLGRLLAAWRKAFANEPTKTGIVVDRAEGIADVELSEVVREIAEDRGGTINRRRFGRWIARHEMRIVEGLRFRRSDGTMNAERWIVESVSSVRSVSVPQTDKSVRSPAPGKGESVMSVSAVSIPQTDATVSSPYPCRAGQQPADTFTTLADGNLHNRQNRLSARWLVHFEGRDPVETYFSPPAVQESVLTDYPGAIAAEPLDTTGHH